MSVTVDERGPVHILTLDRPSKLNAIDDGMLGVLTSEARRFADSPSLQVLLLRAKGRYFSAGADLRSGLVPDLGGRSPVAFRQWLREGRTSLNVLVQILEAVEKPVVVAHQGPCLGGALEISMACDFRLAAADARYALPEVRLGAVPSAGGLARLTQLVGPHWARWFLMAGREVDADRALGIGLVHEVYPQESFIEAVDRFCDALAGMPRETVGAAKLAIELAAELAHSGGRNLERVVESALIFGDEAQACMDAVRAGLGGREPSDSD